MIMFRISHLDPDNLVARNNGTYPWSMSLDPCTHSLHMECMTLTPYHHIYKSELGSLNTHSKLVICNIFTSCTLCTTVTFMLLSCPFTSVHIYVEFN